MKKDIIIKKLKWLRNHLLHICLILFFVLIFLELIIGSLGVNININKLIDDNSPVINLIIGVSGIGGAVVLYCDYLSQKQHEAVFGFYANMRFFLKRLSVFLGDNFSQCVIFFKLYSKSAYEKNCTTKPTKEHIDAFRTLCLEFISFLSNSKDNIPVKQGSKEFLEWYDKQIEIIELLQRGTFFSVNSYGDYSDKSKLKDLYDNIKADIAYFNKAIEEKIKDDSLL